MNGVQALVEHLDRPLGRGRILGNRISQNLHRVAGTPVGPLRAPALQRRDDQLPPTAPAARWPTSCGESMAPRS